MFGPSGEPDDAVSLPEQFSTPSEPASTMAPWWEAFGEPELDRLIREALAENFSLRQAWSRLQQARAVAAQSRSALYPDLTLTAGAAAIEQEGGTAGPGQRTSFEEYSLGLFSSYELDLWGRVRSVRQAALLEADAGALDLQSAAMTLSARIADVWFAILSQRAQHDVLERQLQSNREVLELIELRFRNALATALDVYQQQQVIAETESLLPLVEAQEKVLLHELAALVGQVPGDAFVVAGDRLPEAGEVPSVGLPADLLSNRPDIRSEALRLEAAGWTVSAAKADRFPALRITAQGSYTSPETQTLFDNWILNLAGNLAAPLFDAGRRSAEVDKAQAEVDARVAAYREVVVNAIKEVESALVQESKQREHLLAVEGQLEAARRTYRESGDRYLNGLIDYLPVLTALVGSQRLEVLQIQKNYELLTYRLALHRALGGTWMETLQPEGLAAGEGVTTHE